MNMPSSYLKVPTVVQVIRQIPQWYLPRDVPYIFKYPLGQDIIYDATGTAAGGAAATAVAAAIVADVIVDDYVTFTTSGILRREK